MVTYQTTYGHSFNIKPKVGSSQRLNQPSYRIEDSTGKDRSCLN